MGRYSDSGSTPSKRGAIGCCCVGMLAVMFFGAIFFIYGLYSILGALTFLPGTVSAQGKVVHCYRAKTDCDPLVVDFTTQTGQHIRFTEESSNVFYEREEVPVRYHPDNPSGAQVSSSDPTDLVFSLAALFFASFIFIVIGLVFLGMYPYMIFQVILQHLRRARGQTSREQ